MSILIPSMEMPKEIPVLFCIHPDGKVFADLEGGWKEYKAVELPPHGRLIDADALITTFCEWGTRLERGRKLVITMSEAKQAIVDIIEDAPTIIPAEEVQE